MLEHTIDEISQIFSECEDIVIIGNADSEFQTYKARRISDNKMIVIKEIPIKKLTIYQKLKGKENENVCKVYDAIEYSADGKKIGLVFQEYINGVDLYDYVVENGVLNEKEAVYLGRQLCFGISFLHKNNIIHKDLSYSNIMIDNTNIAKIIDFGASKIVDKKKKETTVITKTAGFGAPEIEHGDVITKAADIYSLGVVLKFMITGFSVKNKMNENSKLTTIIKTCMEYDPKNRYKSISKVGRKLSRLAKKYSVYFKKDRTRELIVRWTVIALVLLTYIGMYMKIIELSPVDSTNNYDEMAYYEDLWMKIDSQLLVKQQYGSVQNNLDSLMNEDVNGEVMQKKYAYAYMAQGKYDEAVDTLLIYLKDEYGYANVLTTFNEFYINIEAVKDKVSDNKRTEIVKAETEIKKYCNLWSEAGECYNNKKYDQAIVKLDTLFQCGAKAKAIYMLKIECYLAKGDKTKAKETYNTYKATYRTIVGNGDYNTVNYAYEQDLFERVQK